MSVSVSVSDNNQFTKKKENVLKTRKIDRELIYYRELTSMFYHMQHEILFSLFFLHETLNALRNELLRE